MDVNLLIAALSGFIGAIILTLLIYLLKLFGQDVDIPYLIGIRFVNIEHKTKAYLVGILLHLIIGAGWGVLYVTLLRGLAITINWPAGILWGFAHGVFTGTMLGILAESHPYIGAGKPISEPGIMGSNWGTLIPYWILGLHVIFGASSLAIYYRLVLA
ncbi:MAG: hypothetical protein PVI44_10075 [Balneolaceae bacterium]|jgi:hypothetical protein